MISFPTNQLTKRARTWYSKSKFDAIYKRVYFSTILHNPSHSSISSAIRYYGKSHRSVVLPLSLVAFGAVAGTTLSREERREKLYQRISPIEKEAFQVKGEYEIKGCLGAGAFAKVYRAVRRQDQSQVALKAIHQSSSRISDFQREIHVLNELSNPGNVHVCQLHDQHQDDEYFYVAMELIGGTDLFEHLSRCGPIEEATAAKLLSQLADALSYIHSKGFIHADLKPENIMLQPCTNNEEGGDSVSLKVIDFGNARKIDYTTGKSVSNSVGCSFGTVTYLPPEVLDQKDLDGKVEQGQEIGPTSAADMFAAGIIMYMCVVGSHPFDPSGEALIHEINNAILKTRDEEGFFDEFVFGERTKSLSPLCVNLLKGLLEPVPQKRMKSKEFRDHPWIVRKSGAKV